MDAPKDLEILRVELAKIKAETKRMARWLRGKELAVKRKKKEMRRTKRVKKVMLAVNRRMEKMVHDFLLAAEAESNDPQTAKTWTEKAVREVTEGMNNLSLKGNNTVNPVQPSGRNGSAANGDSN